jgi:hypothetical protein
MVTPGTVPGEKVAIVDVSVLAHDQERAVRDAIIVPGRDRLSSLPTTEQVIAALNAMAVRKELLAPFKLMVPYCIEQQHALWQASFESRYANLSQIMSECYLRGDRLGSELDALGLVLESFYQERKELDGVVANAKVARQRSFLRYELELFVEQTRQRFGIERDQNADGGADNDLVVTSLLHGLSGKPVSVISVDMKLNHLVQYTSEMIQTASAYPEFRNLRLFCRPTPHFYNGRLREIPWAEAERTYIIQKGLAPRHEQYAAACADNAKFMVYRLREISSVIDEIRANQNGRS